MMLSAKQCELARVMTKDTISDIQMNAEYQTMSDADKTIAADQIDVLLKAHNMPFDKGIDLLQDDFAKVASQDDFAKVASQFQISPATLFCVYMASKNK